MAPTQEDLGNARTPTLPADPGRRYWIRSALGLLLLGAVAFPFFSLLAAVERQVPTILGFDTRVADRLNALANDTGVVLDISLAVTQLGGTAAAVAVFVVVAVVLWAAGDRRLAAYVAATGLGLAVLIPTSKALVGRPRPLVEAPVTDLPVSGSFPSGHTATAVVLFGCVAVVALWRTRLPRGARGAVIAAVVAGSVAVGLTRLVLGVHFVTDVVAGWSLGAAWLAVTTGALYLRRAEQSPSTRDTTATDGVSRPVRPPRLGVAESVLLAGWSWVVVVMVVVASGMSITGPIAYPPVSALDTSVTQQMLTLRSDVVTEVARAGGAAADTVVVISVLLAAAMTLTKVTRSWRPAMFLVVCVAGESLAYLVSSRIVDRIRPDIADLTTGLPDAASWPSGHVAAAVALYGALALLVTTTRRGAVCSVAAVILAAVAVVGVSRVYLAAHYASDVLAGATLGAMWLTACWRVLRPGRVGDTRRHPHAHATPETNPGEDAQPDPQPNTEVDRAVRRIYEKRVS